MNRQTSPLVRNRIEHFLKEQAIGTPQQTGGTMTVSRPMKEQLQQKMDEELEKQLDFGDPDDPDDIDDDDDDDDDDWDDEIMEVATDEAAVLTDARMILLRHPDNPKKLMMVAQIDNPFDDEFDNPEDGFDLDGDEMWDGQMILLMDRGFGGAKKFRAAAPDPYIFKKKNYRGEIE